MSEPRVLATVTDYAGLVRALRCRADELGASREVIGVLAGLPDGHAGRLLGARMPKTLGPVSMNLMLEGLACELWLVESAHSDRIRQRIAKLGLVDAGHKMLATRKRRKPRLPTHRRDFQRLARARQITQQSKRKRRQIAQHAAVIRWEKVKAAVASDFLPQKMPVKYGGQAVVKG